MILNVRFVYKILNKEQRLLFLSVMTKITIFYNDRSFENSRTFDRDHLHDLIVSSRNAGRSVDRRRSRAVLEKISVRDAIEFRWVIYSLAWNSIGFRNGVSKDKFLRESEPSSRFSTSRICLFGQPFTHGCFHTNFGGTLQSERFNLFFHWKSI